MRMQHGEADKKLTNKIQASHTLEGTVLENVENIICRYFSVTITNYGTRISAHWVIHGNISVNK